MQITPAMVKELREKTGAGIMDCKEALTATSGSLEEAVDYLRKKGLQAATKRSSRSTGQGAVGSYIHGGGRIGVLVEVNCETDFVARTDDFQELVRDLAMHIAATDPASVSRDEINPTLVESERQIYRTQAINEGKPEKILDKIVEGKLEKFYAESCLLEQAFVKDPERTINDLLQESISKIGENIVVKRFTRYRLGE